MENKILDINCCGCSACSVICPHNAIKMDFNDVGAYTPYIDSNKCVNCGMCEKVCSVLNYSNVDARQLSKQDVFVGVAKDKTILNRSSSGGIGYIFAQKALDMGMSVCGVTYDAENEQAAHIIIKIKKDLYKIQGSKYLQSANCKAFSEILKYDKGIIFGTPCQIAGIDKVLKIKRKREDFILIDIFCHGVPSQLLWQKHLEWLKTRKNIEDKESVVFREGKDFRINIGKYRAWYNEDAFYTFFLRGFLYNKSCYNCFFRRKTFADIRIGDCMSDKYNKLTYSPSCILANTQNGLRFLDICKDEIELHKETYSEIDNIQESSNLLIPKNYEENILKLRNGIYPENIIKKTMIFGRFKSLIKNRILKKFKRYI